MHTFLKRSITVTAVTLAFAGAAIASQSSKPASSKPAQTRPAATSGSTAKSRANMPSAHSATGTIEKFDANTLTLKTASGEEQFTLASSAQVRNGSRTIKADELSGLSGHRAKVRYTESNGQRTAESVMVSSGSHKGSAKPKTTK